MNPSCRTQTAGWGTSGRSSTDAAMSRRNIRVEGEHAASPAADEQLPVLMRLRRVCLETAWCIEFRLWLLRGSAESVVPARSSPAGRDATKVAWQSRVAWGVRLVLSSFVLYVFALKTSIKKKKGYLLESCRVGGQAPPPPRLPVHTAGAKHGGASVRPRTRGSFFIVKGWGGGRRGRGWCRRLGMGGKEKWGCLC